MHWTGVWRGHYSLDRLGLLRKIHVRKNAEIAPASTPSVRFGPRISIVFANFFFLHSSCLSLFMPFHGNIITSFGTMPFRLVFVVAPSNWCVCFFCCWFMNFGRFSHHWPAKHRCRGTNWMEKRRKFALMSWTELWHSQKWLFYYTLPKWIGVTVSKSFPLSKHWWKRLK